MRTPRLLCRWAVEFFDGRWQLYRRFPERLRLGKFLFAHGMILAHNVFRL